MPLYLHLNPNTKWAKLYHRKSVFTKWLITLVQKQNDLKGCDSSSFRNHTWLGIPLPLRKTAAGCGYSGSRLAQGLAAQPGSEEGGYIPLCQLRCSVMEVRQSTPLEQGSSGPIRQKLKKCVLFPYRNCTSIIHV